MKKIMMISLVASVLLAKEVILDKIVVSATKATQNIDIMILNLIFCRNDDEWDFCFVQ